MAWIDTLLKRMVDLGSSDLHLASACQPQFRLHGEMTPVEGTVEVSAEQMETVLHEISSKEVWDGFKETWDADFAYAIEGCGRFRVNLFMDHKGAGAVLRLIPEKIPSASDLGLPPSILEMCNHSKGLVLVTGPTGSGKSTTLAAMVDHINASRPDHIITIEDPIEFVHPNKRCLINQREVSRHTVSFKRALKAALREDPDIVLVGEMRDLETIAIAIETAETGHLVFGTLHTSTAPSTVNRIIDQFPAGEQAQIRMMLASSLRGVVAQTLCKKVGGGRVAAHEILISNGAVAALIREGKTHQIVSQMQIGGKLGMRLLNDTLIDLVQKNLVDPNEAFLKCVDKDDMLTKLSGIGKSPSVRQSVDISSASPASAAAPPPGAVLNAAGPAPSDSAPTPAASDNPVPVGGDAEGDGYADPFEAFRKKRKTT